MQRQRFMAGLAGIGAAAILVGAAWAAASQQATSPPAPAPHDRPGGPGPLFAGLMPPSAFDELADQLGLTPEQRQTINDFYSQATPGFVQLHKQMQANAELLLNTRPDDSGYTTIVANVSQSAAEIASQLVLQGSQLRSQVFGVLTAGQKARLVTVQAAMRASMRSRVAGGLGPSPPPG
jgi:Spy/CpxP family protein refolding chaperone